MTRHRRSAVVFVALVLPVVTAAVACSRPPEQQFLTQFFRAAKARDNTTLAMMSAVTLDPREKGSVEDFTITSVTPETRTPLDLKTLLQAERQARDAEAEFAKRKMDYQNANLPMIEQVVKLERDPTAKMNAAQQAVKAEWDKWREGIASYARGTSTATAAIKRATGVAEASLTQPGQPALDPRTFEGETIKKDVTVKAEVKSPEGTTTEKTLVITIERVAGGGREGRPIITRITGL